MVTQEFALRAPLTRLVVFGVHEPGGRRHARRPSRRAVPNRGVRRGAVALRARRADPADARARVEGRRQRAPVHGAPARCRARVRPRDRAAPGQRDRVVGRRRRARRCRQSRDGAELSAPRARAAAVVDRDGAHRAVARAVPAGVDARGRSAEHRARRVLGAHVSPRARRRAHDRGRAHRSVAEDRPVDVRHDRPVERDVGRRAPARRALDGDHGRRRGLRPDPGEPRVPSRRHRVLSRARHDGARRRRGARRQRPSTRLPHVYVAKPRAWGVHLPLDIGPPAITLAQVIPVSEPEYQTWRRGIAGFETDLSRRAVEVADLRRTGV